jgi:hypothetical protein
MYFTQTATGLPGIIHIPPGLFGYKKERVREGSHECDDRFMINDEESRERDDGFFSKNPAGTFRMRSTCVRTGLHARLHACLRTNMRDTPSYFFIENPVGTFPDDPDRRVPSYLSRISP